MSSEVTVAWISVLFPKKWVNQVPSWMTSCLLDTCFRALVHRVQSLHLFGCKAFSQHIWEGGGAVVLQIIWEEVCLWWSSKNCESRSQFFYQFIMQLHHSSIIRVYKCEARSRFQPHFHREQTWNSEVSWSVCRQTTLISLKRNGQRCRCPSCTSPELGLRRVNAWHINKWTHTHLYILSVHNHLLLCWWTCFRQGEKKRKTHPSWTFYTLKIDWYYII